MSYSRSFYVFSSILYLNKPIKARYLISGSYVHCRWFSGSFWSRKEEGEENWQQHRNVGTSRRSSIVTSRCLVNKRKKVNECSNVATSSRFLPHNHKKQRGPNLEGIEERTEESTEKKAAMIGDIGKDNCFVVFFSHKLLMIYRIMGAVDSKMF